MNAPLPAHALARPAPEFTRFTVTPCTPQIGGVIEGLHLSALDDTVADELRRALWHYGVLFAREQHLSFEQQKQVASCFGDELERHTFGRTMADQGHPEVLLIQKTAATRLVTTTDVWHHDVTGRPNPTLMSILQADEVPFGADTMWASMRGAYERLPYALKLLFLHLDIDHETLYGALRHDQVSRKVIGRMVEADEASTHPAVIHHPFTGEPILFVGNAWVKRVHGYSADHSEPILRLATDMARQPELQVRWQWRKGDCALWDNFGTTHYGVVGDTGSATRRLHRVSAFSRKIRPSLDRERAVRELMASQA